MSIHPYSMLTKQYYPPISIINNSERMVFFFFTFAIIFCFCSTTFIERNNLKELFSENCNKSDIGSNYNNYKNCTCQV